MALCTDNKLIVLQVVLAPTWAKWYKLWNIQGCAGGSSIANHFPTVCGMAVVGIVSTETRKELDPNSLFEVYNLNCISPLCEHTHSQQNCL